MTLRWMEAGLFYQIDFTQVGLLNDQILELPDLVELAEGMQ